MLLLIHFFLLRNCTSVSLKNAEEDQQKNGYAEETLTLFCPPVQIVDPMPLVIQGVVHSNSYPYMACE